jgi:oxygen-independent coproporphyrinogen-3 oxidase
MYIHLPFCRRICPFCDFVVVKRQKNSFEQQQRSYVQALGEELVLRQENYSQHKLTTLYFGGGTPSLLSIDFLSQLFRQIGQTFEISEDAEVTLEVDPETVDTAKVRSMLDLGVNRLSLGLQSLHSNTLKMLGRGYDSSKARELLEICQSAGANNLSVDLIFGVPGQHRAELEKDIDELSEIAAVKHISTYGLTVDSNSKFLKRLRRLKTSMATSDDQAIHMQAVMSRLQERRFEHYEVSNFCRSGFQSRHNLGYWLGRNVISLGVGAFGYLDGRRYWNINALNHYQACLEGGVLPTAGSEILTSDASAFETLMLRLRLRSGISRHDINKLVQFPGRHFFPTVRSFEKRGLMRWQSDNLQFTDSGLLVSDAILAELNP